MCFLTALYAMGLFFQLVHCRLCYCALCYRHHWGCGIIFVATFAITSFNLSIMKKLLLTLAAAGSMLTAAAQGARGYDYETALGVKVWDGGGVSLKHFIQPNAALEGIAYFYSHGTRITGLYEIHGNIGGAPGLRWYLGPGAHVGFYNAHYLDAHTSATYAGVDGVLGLDYKFKDAPINVSLDWQPSFEFGSDRGFVGSWGGLGIRYTF